VWTNLEALTRGLEIMLQKYGAFPAFRKQCSRRYMEFGIRFCDRREIAKGRKALLKAMRLHPYQIRPYLYFVLALLGAAVFTTVRENKPKLFARLGAYGVSR
jgi:hypothetical protein